ncbi:tensin-1 [Trichinella spiralis]|uniref:tensin-1 n=1 Tax=Trichinella spiralis TaxID=6334 RepID=UPI0001EFDF93|nr:tensin-1 [Trichinella spiralis]
MRGGNGNLSSVQLVFFCCSCCCPIDFIYKVQHLHAVLPSPGNIMKSSQRTRNSKVTRNNSCQPSSMLTFAFAGCDDLYSKSVQLTIKMLASKHDGKFKIFNVSKERSELANLNVFECGWPECLAPALEKLCTICKEMDRWLELSTENVVVIHQKGGFRRAAVVVSAFMHYCSICASESQMLEHLAMQQYCKQHSLLPSQRRTNSGEQRAGCLVHVGGPWFDETMSSLFQNLRQNGSSVHVQRCFRQYSRGVGCSVSTAGVASRRHLVEMLLSGR